MVEMSQAYLVSQENGIKVWRWRQSENGRDYTATLPRGSWCQDTKATFKPTLWGMESTSLAASCSNAQRRLKDISGGAERDRLREMEKEWLAA